MMELGTESLDEHKNLLTLIREHNFKNVILVGSDFEKIHHPYKYFQTSGAASAYIREQNFRQTYFLVKGSRSTQMEKVLTAFNP